MNNSDWEYIINFNRLNPTIVDKIAEWCFPEWLNTLNKQDKLYYYTDINALVNGILEDRNNICLWASRYSHLNDPTEITASIQELKKVLPQEDKCLIDNVSRMIKNNHSISFSVYPDFLPMWKMYGNGGKGVMLTFDTMEIVKQYRGLLQPCLYRGSEDYEQTKERVLDILSHPELKELAGELQQTVRMFMLQLFVSTAKNNEYLYEKEVRLIGLGNSFFGDNSRRQQYRVSNNQIIPYMKVDIPSSAIKGVCLGPLAKSELNKETLEEFLLYKGYDNVKVSTSNIQYR